jgi:hypothetical protein
MVDHRAGFGGWGDGCMNVWRDGQMVGWMGAKPDL